MKAFTLVIAWIASIVAAFFLGDYCELSRYTAFPSKFGRFLSTPKVDVLDDAPRLKLLEDFVYVDPYGDPWLAPKGREVDGASIPPLFWSATGGPLSGKYRNASIIHDVECDDKKRNSDKVHLMFYHACLAGGVPKAEAKRLYWAVARFGPRWAKETKTRAVEFIGRDGEMKTFVFNEAVSRFIESTPPTQDDVAWAQKYFKNNDPPVGIIPSLGDLSDEIP